MTEEKFLEFIKLNIKQGIYDEYYFEMIMIAQAKEFGFDLEEKIEDLLND